MVDKQEAESECENCIYNDECPCIGDTESPLCTIIQQKIKE